MTDNLFIKLCDDFNIEWDLDNILSHFIEDKVDPYASIQKYHAPYSDPSGKPHWQLFPTGISFSRNLYKNFSKECIIAYRELLSLQKRIKSSNTNLDNILIKEFINCNLLPSKFNLIRVFPGKSVMPHIDATRWYSLNIGLKNSNSAITHVSCDDDLQTFNNSPKMSFRMNDKDAYILNVQKPHSVESTVAKSSGIVRYLISYNLKI